MPGDALAILGDKGIVGGRGLTPEQLAELNKAVAEGRIKIQRATVPNKRFVDGSRPPKLEAAERKREARGLKRAREFETSLAGQGKIQLSRKTTAVKNGLVATLPLGAVVEVLGYGYGKPGAYRLRYNFQEYIVETGDFEPPDFHKVAEVMRKHGQRQDAARD